MALTNGELRYSDMLVEQRARDDLVGYATNNRSALPGELHATEYAQELAEPWQALLRQGTARAPYRNADHVLPIRQKRRENLWLRPDVTVELFFDEAQLTSNLRTPRARLVAARQVLKLVTEAPDHVSIGMLPSESDPVRARRAAYSTSYHRLEFDDDKGPQFYLGDGSTLVTDTEFAAVLEDSHVTHRENTITDTQGLQDTLIGHIKVLRGLVDL
jgi:hypothetical protein